MNDKETEPTPDQSKVSDQPFVVKQPEREVPYAFNAKPEDTSKTEAVETVPVSVTPRKKKRGLIISLIAIAVILLGLGLTYVYWYQNPNKVVSDAVVHALAADSLTYTGTVTTVGPTKMVVTLNGGAAADGGTVNAKFAFDVDGKKYTFDGSGIIDKESDLYLKVQNISGLADNYRRAIPAESQKLFDEIIAKVDDKWIKISSEDLKSYSADIANTQKCTADAVKKLQSDKSIESELIETYKKHPFITIDKSLGAKEGSLGYALSANQDTAKAFAKDYKNTSLYKSMVECDSSFAINDEDILKQAKDKTGDKTSVDLWVNRWTHHITQVVIKDEAKSGTSNISFEPKFNRPVTITTPKDSTTIEQLQKDVIQLLQPAQSPPVTQP